jgi:hypothetical protein
VFENVIFSLVSIPTYLLSDFMDPTEILGLFNPKVETWENNNKFNRSRSQNLCFHIQQRHKDENIFLILLKNKSHRCDIRCIALPLKFSYNFKL